LKNLEELLSTETKSSDERCIELLGMTGSKECERMGGKNCLIRNSNQELPCHLNESQENVMGS